MVNFCVGIKHFIVTLHDEFLVFKKKENVNSWEFKEVIKCGSDSLISYGAIDCCAFSPCSNYFGVCFDKNIVIYETSLWKILCVSSGERKGSCLQFFNKSKSLIFANKSGCVIFYSFENNTLEKINRSFKHNSMLTRALITADEKFVITCDRDEKIRVTNYPNVYNIERFCLGHTQFVTWIDFLPSDPKILVSCSGDGTLRFWDYMCGTELGVYNFNLNVELEDVHNKVVLTKVVMCKDNLTSILAAIQYKSYHIRLLRVTTNSIKCLVVDEINVLNLDCIPWDISFCENHLICIQPNKNHSVKVWSVTDNKFVNDIRFQPIQEYFSCYFDTILSATQKISDNIPILFKKEFNNLEEYAHRKKARLLKEKKLKKLK